MLSFVGAFAAAMPLSPDVPADERIECDSTFESLEEIVCTAQAYATDAFEDEDTAHRFVLALSEAVANAIEHGNASEPQKQLVVELRTFGGRVEAVVTDQGGGFDPAAVENPLRNQNLMRSHGRGLHIIHRVSDEVHYEMGGRRVRMAFLKTQ